MVVRYLIIILFLCSFAAADCAYYFYTDDCADCGEVKAHLEQLKEEYPLTVQEFEVYYNEENSALLEELYNASNVPEESQGLPAVFLPGSYFIGKNSIISLLEASIRGNKDRECPSAASFGVVGESIPSNAFNTFTFSSLTWNAFSDGASKGMLMLLVILIIITISTNYLKGWYYLIGAFVAYLLYGFNLLTWNIPYLNYLVGIGGIVFGVYGIQRFLKRKYMKKYKFKNSYLFIGVGLVAGMLSFSSMDKIFQTLQNLFQAGIARFTVFLLIIFYLMVSFVIITLYMVGLNIARDKAKHHTGKKPTHKVEMWDKHFKRVIDVSASLLCLLIGIILLI